MTETTLSTAQPESQSVGYWQLLRQNPRFRWLWTAELISAGGDWFNNVAVLGLVLRLTSSGLGASLVILCSSIPMFFLIPIAGPVVDRFDRKQIMIWTNILSAGVALLYLFVHDANMLWLLYLATVLLIVLASFFGPASMASVPNIVTEAELFPANALSGSTWGIMVMVGSALGGIVSVLFGRDVAFVINSLSFVIAAILIAGLDIPSPRSEKQMTPWRDFREGIDYLRHYLPAAALVAVKAGWSIAGGVIVLISVFGSQVFHAGDAGIGALYSARGVGALLGPIVVQAIVGRRVGKLRVAVCMAFFICCLGYLIFAGSGWASLLWLGCVALCVAHFGGGISWVISNVLLQMTTPDRLRGRVFAVDYGMSTLTTGISTLIYGLALQNNASPMTLSLIGAIIFLVFGLVWAIATGTGPLTISDATVANAPH
jgi:MFS family permease